MILFNNEFVVAESKFEIMIRGLAFKYSAADFETPYGVIIPVTHIHAWGLIDYLKTVPPESIANDPEYNSRVLSKDGYSDLIHIGNNGHIYICEVHHSKDGILISKKQVPNSACFKYVSNVKAVEVNTINILLEDKTTLKEALEVVRKSTKSNFTETIVFNTADYTSDKKYNEICTLPIYIPFKACED